MILHCMHWDYISFFDSTVIRNLTNCLEVILISKLPTLGTMEWILSVCWFKGKYYIYTLTLKVEK